MRNKYTLIPNGRYKGKRLYFEELNDNITIFQTEMYFLFQHSLKQNYKIFYLHCKPNHNIVLSKKELDFFKTSIKLEDEELYKKYNFSNEALKIKEFQYQDLLTLYGLSIETSNIGAIFTYPKLEDNFYCFDLLLVIKNDFNLDIFLNINFNIIKIYSIIEHNKDMITIDWIEKLYNFNNLQFKDYIVLFEDKLKCSPYNLFDLPEKKELENQFSLIFKYSEKFPNSNNTYMQIELDRLKEKLWAKERELFDIELHKKLCFEKLCMQVFIFHEIIEDDAISFTNAFQLFGGAVINNSDSKIKINYDDLYPYPLSDIHEYDYYALFTVWNNVYYWKKKWNVK